MADIPEVQWALTGFAPLGFTQVWGTTGVGHPWFGIQVCYAVITGNEVLKDRAQIRGTAVYLTLDNDKNLAHV